MSKRRGGGKGGPWARSGPSSLSYPPFLTPLITSVAILAQAQLSLVSFSPAQLRSHPFFLLGMPTFQDVFDPPAAMQQVLWLFLGLDHVSRARLRRAWNTFDVNMHNATPTFLVMVGVVTQNVPYFNFYLRARGRVDDWRRDSYAGRPPVGPRGYAVFLGWDRLTGHVRPEPYEDTVDPLGGRVWVSANRTAPPEDRHCRRPVLARRPCRHVGRPRVPGCADVAAHRHIPRFHTGVVGAPPLPRSLSGSPSPHPALGLRRNASPFAGGLARRTCPRHAPRPTPLRLVGPYRGGCSYPAAALELVLSSGLGSSVSPLARCL